MGTNYYAVKKEPVVFDHALHLGKSSGGWLFTFNDCEQFHTFPQFTKWLEENVDSSDAEYILMDEYNREISSQDLLNMIKRKQEDPESQKRSYDVCYPGRRNIDGYIFLNENFC